MNRIFHILEPIIELVIRHPLKTVILGLVLAVGSTFLALELRIDNDFSKLIPQHYPSVQALNELREQVGGESEVNVVIESPSFAINKAFAEALIPHAMKLRYQRTGERLFNSYIYQKNLEFLQENGLYFATTHELTMLIDFLRDEVREAKLEANPFFLDLEEDWEDEVGTDQDSIRDELKGLYDELVGTEYLISDDSTALAIRFLPNTPKTDIDFVRATYDNLQALVDSLQPATYHPQMEITLAGRLYRHLVEIEAITSDVTSSFGTGVLMLLLMVVAYFMYKSYTAKMGRRWSRSVFLQELTRTPAIAMVIALPLLFSILVTLGITYLTYQTLNIMTSTLALLLFGMGIDFGIHFYARYTEERGGGADIEEATRTTFMTTGQAISVVAITTSIAFFILMIARFRGFSEFGFIAGIGIIIALAAMIFLLPAFLIFFERRGWLRMHDARFEQLAQPDSTLDPDAKRFPYARGVVVGSVLLVIGAIWLVPNLSFEYDFGKLEPYYEQYYERARKMDKFYSDQSHRNPAYILADTPEDSKAIVEILRTRAEIDSLSPTIREVESIQDRFPLQYNDQQAKLARLDTIRSLLQDPFLRDQQDETLDRLRRASSTQQPLDIDQVPAFIKKPFTTKSGEIGQLVLIYPSVNISDGRKSIQFTEDVEKVSLPNGNVYYAASTSIVASQMLELMLSETPYMIGLTILFIIVFKLIILRKEKWMLLALLPLVSSFLWMFGIMDLMGLKLNFYNLVILPTVLGIGDDSGIHIVHRYLEEGEGSIRKVLRTTGEHVTISAMTTMLGFGSLLISDHPGLRTIGELAVLGIGLTLIAALIFLPALLQWLEDRKKGVTVSSKQ
jgi:predicted RND superfamily exporter protein